MAIHANPEFRRHQAGDRQSRLVELIDNYVVVADQHMVARSIDVPLPHDLTRVEAHELSRMYREAGWLMAERNQRKKQFAGCFTLYRIFPHENASAQIAELLAEFSRGMQHQFVVTMSHAVIGEQWSELLRLFFSYSRGSGFNDVRVSVVDPITVKYIVGKTEEV